MRLTQEQIESVNWNDFSNEEIECLIDLGCITQDDMNWYYNNNQWKDNDQ